MPRGRKDRRARSRSPSPDVGSPPVGDAPQSPPQTSKRKRRLSLNVDDRHAADGFPNHIVNRGSQAVFGVFSREASVNYARAYNEMLVNKKNLTKASDKVEAAHRAALLGAMEPLVQTDDLDQQLTAAFRGREVPHVLTVIEGEAGDEPVNIDADHEDGTTVRHRFERSLFIEGKARKGGAKDKKQNMMVYVRSDMKHVYRAEKETVGEGARAYPVANIRYQTQDAAGGEKRESAHSFVHIPNDLAKKRQSAVDDLIEFGKRHESDYTWTGFSGDTNFNGRPLAPHGAASVGGLAPSREYLTYKSSPAQVDKNYMQVVPAERVPGGTHTVLQPSALNPVTGASLTRGAIGIDHLSMITRVDHKGRLAAYEDANTATTSSAVASAGGSAFGGPAVSGPVQTAPFAVAGTSSGERPAKRPRRRAAPASFPPPPSAGASGVQPKVIVPTAMPPF